MAETTEAECLLRSGAAYPRRVGLVDDSGALVFAGFKPGGFSLYFGDEPYIHFDLEGRWQRALIGGTHYLKALDGSIESIDRDRLDGAGLVLRRRRLSFAEAADLDADIRGKAIDILDGLESGRLRLEPPSGRAEPIDRSAVSEFLDRVASWDAAAWFRQREDYLATYGPPPFLPPSCSSPIILQATLGDPGGHPFGGSEAVEPLVRTPEEFEAHARRVASLLGRRAAQARGVVLCGAGVLRRPDEAVSAYLDIAAAVFPIVGGARPRLSQRPEGTPLLDGIYAFLDDFAPPRPGADALRRYRERHLRRVDLGVESGSAEVRSLYGRSWSDDDLRDSVADLKAADIETSVVLLIGSGGVEGSEAHVRGSIDLIGSLALGREDLVYLVDADEIGGETRRSLLISAGRSPLSEADKDRERAAIREGLAGVRAAKGFKLLAYTMQKQ
jgi:hypothetical protein